MNLCIEFCMDTCLEVWNTSFLCRILVWNGFLVWLWSSMEENLYRENVGF